MENYITIDEAMQKLIQFYETSGRSQEFVQTLYPQIYWKYYKNCTFPMYNIVYVHNFTQVYKYLPKNKIKTCNVFVVVIYFDSIINYVPTTSRNNNSELNEGINVIQEAYNKTKRNNIAFSRLGLLTVSIGRKLELTRIHYNLLNTFEKHHHPIQLEKFIKFLEVTNLKS